MRRPTNLELCAQFRELLTEGFHVDPEYFIDHETAVAATKDWRGEVWKAFRGLEDRLCPTAKFARTGEP